MDPNKRGATFGPAGGRMGAYCSVAACHSLEHWRTKIGEEIFRVDIASLGDADAFTASLLRKPFASAELLRFDVAPESVERTRTGIARDGCSDVALVYQASGSVRLRQFGRDVAIRAGDCYTIDFSSPFDIATLGRSRHLTLRTPRSWFSQHMQPEDIAARRIDGSAHWGRVLSQYLRVLFDDFDNELPMSPQLMGEQALQLVELAMSEHRSSGSTHQKGMLRRIRSLLREVCHEEDLTPQSVADRAGVSKGYLHRLFATAGTTFCAELDALRIERAAGLLESAGQRHLTVNEIGLRCGLASASHFCRKFRELKGVSPTQYRDGKRGA